MLHKESDYGNSSKDRESLVAQLDHPVAKFK